jgi:hypothetical protein
MRLIPIKVECYAGIKADETPRRFIWEERLIEVEEIFDRWYGCRPNPLTAKRILHAAKARV